MLQQLGAQNPELLQQIQQNQEAFIRLINEPLSEAAMMRAQAGLGGGEGDEEGGCAARDAARRASHANARNAPAAASLTAPVLAPVLAVRPACGFVARRGRRRSSQLTRALARQPAVVQVTAEEKAVIERLEAMG